MARTTKSLGTIGVDLDARSAKFSRKMRNAKGQAKSLRFSLTRLVKSVGLYRLASLGAAGAVAAMTGSLKNAVMSTAKMQDETAKLSRRVGVAVETLSAYRLATQLSGTSLDDFATAMRRLSKNALDFSRGIGEAKRSFEDMGIRVTDAEGRLKKVDEVMLDVAERFSQMEDGTRKTAFAVELFGRSGANLIPMLNQGRDGIEKMTEKAKALGIVFDAQTAAQAEKLNDNITELGYAFEGLKISVGNRLIPIFDAAVDVFHQMVGEIRDMDSGAEGLGTRFANLADIMSFPVQIFMAVGSMWNNFIADMTEGVRAMEVRVLALATVLTGLRIIDLSPVIRGQIEAIRRQSEEIDKARKDADWWAEALLNLQKRVAGFAEGARQAAKGQNSLNDALNKSGAIAKKVGGGEASAFARAFGSKVPYQQPDLKAVPWVDQPRALKFLETMRLTYPHVLGAMEEKTKAFGQVWKDQMSTIRSDFGNTMADLVLDFQNWTDTLLGFLRNFARVGIRILSEAFFNKIGGLMSGSGGGGGILGSLIGGALGFIPGVGPLLGGLFNAFGKNKMAGLPGFAGGGILTEPALGITQSGQAFTMAESGPEAITPLGGGNEVMLGVLAELRRIRSIPAGQFVRSAFDQEGIEGVFRGQTRTDFQRLAHNEF
jgi:hypothetical protein